MTPRSRTTHRPVVAAWRIGWVVVTLCVVQGLVSGLSFLPILLLWSVIIERTATGSVLRLVAVSLAVAPSYVLFAMPGHHWVGNGGSHRFDLLFVAAILVA